MCPKAGQKRSRCRLGTCDRVRPACICALQMVQCWHADLDYCGSEIKILDWVSLQDDESEAPPSILLRGHCGAVSGVAFTPAGQLISTDAHGTIIVRRSTLDGQQAGSSGGQLLHHAVQHSNEPAVATIRALNMLPVIMPENRSGQEFLPGCALARIPATAAAAGTAITQESPLAGGAVVRHASQIVSRNPLPLLPPDRQQGRHASQLVHSAASCQPQRPATAQVVQTAAGTCSSGTSAETGSVDGASRGGIRPRLQALLGCNGGPGRTLVWRPETGFLAYAAANAVIIEQPGAEGQRCARCVAIRCQVSPRIAEQGGVDRQL